MATGTIYAIHGGVLNSEEMKLLVKFPPFHHEGKVYDLSHLDPRVVEFIRPGTADLPARVYKANLIFTQHCFTRELPRSGEYDKTLESRDGREIRLFDLARWELSKLLPEIIANMDDRTCRHAKTNNFVTAEMTTVDGKKVEYDIFFVATKAMRPGFINLIIQSAYIRENKQTGKPVKFLNILHDAR